MVFTGTKMNQLIFYLSYKPSFRAASIGKYLIFCFVIPDFPAGEIEKVKKGISVIGRFTGGIKFVNIKATDTEAAISRTDKY